MVDELPHEGGAGAVRVVVGIIGAERQVRDETDGTGGEVVLRVQEPVFLAEFHQRGLHFLGMRREWRQGREHASETVGGDDVPPAALRDRHGNPARERGGRDGAYGMHEAAAAHAVRMEGWVFGVHANSFLIVVVQPTPPSSAHDPKVRAGRAREAEG